MRQNRILRMKKYTHGVDEKNVWWDELKHGADSVLDFLLRRDTRGVDVVDTRANHVRVAVLLESSEQLHVTLRGFNGDNISIETLDRWEDVVEVGVAEVRVSLRGITDTSGGQLEGVNCPAEVVVPVNTTERKLEAIKFLSNHSRK